MDMATLNQGSTNPRDGSVTPRGLPDGLGGNPELFGERPTQARGPCLPSPRTSMGSVGGIPKECVCLYVWLCVCVLVCVRVCACVHCAGQ
jgi:hypothetical protein